MKVLLVSNQRQNAWGVGNPIMYRMRDALEQDERIEMVEFLPFSNSLFSLREIRLSAKEYDVLIYLAKNQGKILTKKQIYENVWNEEYVYDDDNIMAVISRLRKKIERTAENSYIQTVRGLGYRFNKEL